MDEILLILCITEVIKIIILLWIAVKADDFEEGKRQGEHFGYLQGQIDERRRQQRLDSWKDFERAVQRKSRKEKRCQ